MGCRGLEVERRSVVALLWIGGFEEEECLGLCRVCDLVNVVVVVSHTVLGDFDVGLSFVKVAAGLHQHRLQTLQDVAARDAVASMLMACGRVLAYPVGKLIQA